MGLEVWRFVTVVYWLLRANRTDGVKKLSPQNIYIFLNIYNFYFKAVIGSILFNVTNYGMLSISFSFKNTMLIAVRN